MDFTLSLHLALKMVAFLSIECQCMLKLNWLAMEKSVQISTQVRGTLDSYPGFWEHIKCGKEFAEGGSENMMQV